MMRRYRSHSACRNIPELGGWQHGSKMIETEDGGFALYSDAHALEERVAVLEAALKEILSAVDTTELTYEDAYDLLKRGPWDAARKALEGGK